MIRCMIFICCFCQVACHTCKTNSNAKIDNSTSHIETTAQDRFGDNFIIVQNENSKFSLVKSNTKDFKDIGFDIDYFIMDNSTNEILIEDFLKSGHVDWIDEYTVKAVNRKIGGNNKRMVEVYLFNANTREKTLQ